MPTVSSTASSILRAAVLCGLIAGPAPAAAERAITVEDAIRVAREKAPTLAVARADEERARAATITAGQYANPRLLGGGGRMNARRPDTPEGGHWRVELEQPLESPWVRGARKGAAGAALASAQAGTDATDAELVAWVKRAFAGVLLAQGLEGLAQEQLDLLSRVRTGIERKVAVGEGPGLDLARAETEVLNARRQVVVTRVAVTEAHLTLGAALGEPGGTLLSAEGELPAFTLPPREELRGGLTEHNPRIAQARREVERTRRRLELERYRRFDGFGLAGAFEREPDNDKFGVGLRIPLPVWNLRRGQIGEATAELKRAQALLAQRQLLLGRELDGLYNRHQVAGEQVAIIEQGLLEEARRALRGADVAYRSGERGILEYLDAQRTLRDIRFDLLRARNEMERAGIEIERLAGTTR